MTSKYIWAIVQGLAFLYVQVLFAPALEIWGVYPNILLPWMIYTVWKKPFVLAISVSFGIALLYDSTYPGLFGLQALLFVALAVCIDLFRIPFEEQSVVARVLTLALVNLIYALVMYMAMGLLNGFDATLRLISLWGFAYNLVSSFVVFWSMIFLAKLRIEIVHE